MQIECFHCSAFSKVAVAQSDHPYRVEQILHWQQNLESCHGPKQQTVPSQHVHSNCLVTESKPSVQLWTGCQVSDYHTNHTDGQSQMPMLASRKSLRPIWARYQSGCCVFRLSKALFSLFCTVRCLLGNCMISECCMSLLNP